LDAGYELGVHTAPVGHMPLLFESVMNTPSHHRVHHVPNPRYRDSNYAGTLIIWDRMFGSFVPEQEEEAVEYGLVRNIGTFNPIRVAFHEWMGLIRDAMQPGITLRARLGYLFAPPGWSHDGSRQTSEDIKRSYAERNPEAKGAPGL